MLDFESLEKAAAAAVRKSADSQKFISRKGPNLPISKVHWKSLYIAKNTSKKKSLTTSVFSAFFFLKNKQIFITAFSFYCVEQNNYCSNVANFGLFSNNKCPLFEYLKDKYFHFDVKSFGVCSIHCWENST